MHGPRIEPGNLVVGEVSGDVSPGSDSSGITLMPVRGSRVGQPFPVGREILTPGRQNHRIFPQQGQIIGDIAGGAPETLCEAVDHETDVQDVDLFRQDVVRNGREIHDAVIGQGPGNKNLHGIV